MNVRHEVPLSTVLWYRIGGTARYLLEVADQDDLFRALEFVQREQPERVFVVGLGSNLLFPDEYFDGAVIHVSNASAPALEREDDRVRAFGGAVLDDVVRFSFDEGMTGLEWAGGLPGTFGAGVRGNVGAFGGEIKDRVVEAEVVSFAPGQCGVRRLSHADLAFSYRDSRVKQEHHAIVRSATLRLQPAGAEELEAARAVYAGNIAYRRSRHPMEYPNCGSVFKNVHRPDQIEQVLARWPDIEPKLRHDWHGKVSMGYIIGRLGLAGYRRGDAEISRKHNNFIVNLGAARAADVRAIIAMVQASVEQALGFIPEVEIEIVSGAA